MLFWKNFQFWRHPWHTARLDGRHDGSQDGRQDGPSRRAVKTARLDGSCVRAFTAETCVSPVAPPPSLKILVDAGVNSILACSCRTVPWKNQELTERCFESSTTAKLSRTQIFMSATEVLEHRARLWDWLILLEKVLWKANRNSYALYWMVTLPVTLGDPNYPKSPISRFGLPSYPWNGYFVQTLLLSLTATVKCKLPKK